MLKLNEIKQEEDLYLLLSWITDSCDQEMSQQISNRGILKVISAITNSKYLRRLKVL